jgi:GT2 family glycosyltransferase
MQGDSGGKKPSVGAVIVTFNRRALLRQCLDALLMQTRTPDAIYVIDNASTDGTAAMLRGDYGGRVKFQRLPQNLGGAGGFHFGIKLACEEGHDWIWAMDDDVAPEFHCLERLLEYSSRSDSLVPLRVTRAMQVVDQSPLDFNLAKPFFRSPVGARICNRFHSVAEMPPTVPIEAFAFEGPLLARTLVERVGLPMAEFFISGDDTEYALRMRRIAGPRTLCVSRAWMYRALPVCGAMPEWRRYYWWRNHFYLYRRYGDNPLMRLWPIALFVGLLGKALVGSGHKRESIAVVWNAFWDARKEVFPRRYLPSPAPGENTRAASEIRDPAGPTGP